MDAPSCLLLTINYYKILSSNTFHGSITLETNGPKFLHVDCQLIHAKI